MHCPDSGATNAVKTNLDSGLDMDGLAARIVALAAAANLVIHD